MSAATATEVETDTSAEQPSVRKNRHRAVPLVSEYRKFTSPAGRFEVRAEKGSSTANVEGEPIVYDTWYGVRDMFGQFREKIMPGSLTDILGSCDCRLLLNHDGLPIARNTAGTMELEDTETALRFSATLDLRQQLANDFLIAVERGDMDEMSVGMIVGADTWTEERDGEDIVETRTITRLDDLLDVSGVTYAASPTTSISKRMAALALADGESRARLRRLEVSLRNGDTKSEDIIEALVALRQGRALSSDRTSAERAANALKEVLDAAEIDSGDVEAEVEERVEAAAEEESTEDPQKPNFTLAMELRSRRRSPARTSEHR